MKQEFLKNILSLFYTFTQFIVFERKHFSIVFEVSYYVSINFKKTCQDITYIQNLRENKN